MDVSTIAFSCFCFISAARASAMQQAESVTVCQAYHFCAHPQRPETSLRRTSSASVRRSWLPKRQKKRRVCPLLSALTSEVGLGMVYVALLSVVVDAGLPFACSRDGSSLPR